MATKQKPVEERYDYAKLLKEYGTKSAVIRHLSFDGLTRSEITKVTGLRYQHVRNVLIAPVGKEIMDAAK
jgi:hypothetical protein